MKTNKEFILDLKDQIEAHISNTIGIRNIQAVRNENGKVTLTWEGQSDNEIDVQFQISENGKWHSIMWMMEDDLDPDDDDFDPPLLYQNSNLYEFTIPPEKPVNVRLLEGAWSDEHKQFIPVMKYPILRFKAIDQPTRSDLLIGIHDKQTYDDQFSILRTSSLDEARKAQKDGTFVILAFSNRWADKDNNWKKKSRTEWASMIRWMVDAIKTLDPNMCLIEIQDEPLSGHHVRRSGYTSDDIAWLYNEFKKALPTYRFGYSHTRGELNRHSKDPLPMTDVITSPMYYIYQNEEITKEEFREHIERQVNQIKSINKNALIICIGQGFYNVDAQSQNWGEPPLWVVEEYKKVLSELGAFALIFWTIKREGTTRGLGHMPELLNEIKRQV